MKTVLSNLLYTSVLLLYLPQYLPAQDIVDWQKLDSLATAAYEGGAMYEAQTFAQQALANCRIQLGVNDPQCGWCSNNLGIIYLDSYQLEDALETYQDALHIGYEVDLKLQGELLSNIAEALERLGQFAKSVPFYQQAAEVAREAYGAHSFEFAIALASLASIYHEIGNYIQAEPLFLDAAHRLEQRGDTLHPYYNVVLNNFALHYTGTDQLDKALPLALRSLEITAGIQGKESTAYGTRLENIANIYLRLGQRELALAYITKALENSRQTLPAESPDLAISLQNYAKVHREIGAYEIADEYFQASLKLFRKTLGDKSYRTALTLANLATLRGEQGRYQEAEEYQLQAVQVVGKQTEYQGALYAQFLLSLVNFKNHLGQREEALDSCYRALVLINKLYSEDHEIFGTGLNLLARLLSAKQEGDKVLTVARKNAKVRQKQMQRNLKLLSEAGKENFLQLVQQDFNDHFSYTHLYHEDNPDWIVLSTENALSLKDLLLGHTQNWLDVIRQIEDPQINAQLKEWVSIKQLISNNFSLPKAKQKFDIDSLHRVAEKLETALTLDAYGTIDHTASVDWKLVQQQLQVDEVGIEFIHFPFTRAGVPTDSILYAAIIIQAEARYPIFVPLFEERELIALTPSAQLKSRERVKQLYTAELYQLIWSKIQPHLRKVKTVYYAPSGQLHHINLAALPCDEKLYLSDRHQLFQLSSCRKLLDDKLERLQQEGEAWVYGGITYDAPLQELTESSAATKLAVVEREWHWQSLPKTKQEAKQIAHLLDTAGFYVQPYMEAEATESTIKRLMRQKAPEILHFGTHGFFYSTPEKQYENLRKGGRHNFRFSTNPFFRSGLVLSNGNRAWQQKASIPNQEDGILTAYEIAGLDLSNTQLAILSACKSGLGEVKGKEGVYGLQRAFKLAGVDYLLATLWNVPDSDETIDFTTTFLQNCLRPNLTIRQAFHLTQQQMKAKYEDPYFWAAFVLME
ncbi:MAG: CHAT domain-containing protein [Saprospiraceae bacterium]|nr:CHAT domain-containing protein [Saprospiraceae bacterium]